MSATRNCAICGLPIAPAGIPWGYAGPTCPGFHNFDIGTVQFVPQPEPLTAELVRKIVREELERWLPRTPSQGTEP